MWIEMRCDSRCEEFADGDGVNRCWSHDNEGPMQESSDSHNSVIQAVRDLEKEGSALGWKKIRGNWVCPYCSRVKP